MRCNRSFMARLGVAALFTTILSGPFLAAPLAAQNPASDAGSAFTAAELPETRLMGSFDPQLRKAQAIVNGEVITDTDIEQRLNLVIAANGGQITEEERARVRLQVMRNLIDEKLEIQEAANNDIKISDAEVQRSFDRVAANFKRTPQQFSEFLKASGSSEASIKSQIRGEMAWSRLLRRRVEPLVAVGDEEVEAVIAKLNESKGKEEFHVAEIFLSATPETEAQVMGDAARIVGQIRGGASFVAYARQFSEASTAGLGGDLGWVRAEQLADALVPVVTSLQTSNIATAVSDPVRVPGGVTILALIDKRQVLSADPLDAILSLKQMSMPLPPGVTEATARIKVEEFQSATKDMGGCGAVDAVGQRIGATVATNDAVRMRDLPPALQEVMKNLSIGQATPAFGSAKDGLRVLVLCGRDDPAQAGGPNFEQIYAQMSEERVNMRARRYLRDLRRDAIVDYR
jgi:peptidyl-prolyl cis-trans isomerase SurA